MNERKTVALEMLEHVGPQRFALLLSHVIPWRLQWRWGKGFTRIGFWIACRQWEHGEWVISKEILKSE